MIKPTRIRRENPFKNQDLRNAAGIVKEVELPEISIILRYGILALERVSNFGDSHQMQEKSETMGLRI